VAGPANTTRPFRPRSPRSARPALEESPDDENPLLANRNTYSHMDLQAAATPWPPYPSVPVPIRFAVDRSTMPFEKSRRRFDPLPPDYCAADLLRSFQFSCRIALRLRCWDGPVARRLVPGVPLPRECDMPADRAGSPCRRSRVAPLLPILPSHSRRPQKTTGG